MTVWIYTDTSKHVGDPEHLKVFATERDANDWFAKNDPEGVAFEYEVREVNPGASSAGPGGASRSPEKQ